VPHLNRLAFGVPLKVLLPIVLVACCAVALSRRGVEFWSAPRPEEEANPDGQHDQDLAEALREIVLRIERKDSLAEELLDGRLPLLQAAAHFQALDREAPAFNWEQFRRTFPGGDDEERHCREVIAFARAAFRKDPEEQRATVSRLEAELQGHLDRGDLRLPAVVAAAHTPAGPAVIP
jgi:hypothetical protein